MSPILTASSVEQSVSILNATSTVEAVLRDHLS